MIMGNMTMTINYNDNNNKNKNIKSEKEKNDVGDDKKAVAAVAAVVAA